MNKLLLFLCVFVIIEIVVFCGWILYMVSIPSIGRKEVGRSIEA